MGLGSNTPRLKTIYLAPRGYKGKDSNRVLHPHFYVTTKENGVKIELREETEVSGTLVAIQHGEYEDKNSGKTIRTISVVLFDDNTLFKISMDMNSGNARNLMNTICGTKTFDFMRLSMYAKDKFPTLYVSDQPGKSSDRVKWAFDYKAVLEPLITIAPDPQDEKKEIKVYHKLNNFLLDEWKKTEVIVQDYAREKGYDKLGDASKNTPAANTDTTNSTGHLDPDQKKDLDGWVPPNEEPSHNTDNGDDLPF